MARLTEAGGVDVTTTGEDHAVEQAPESGPRGTLQLRSDEERDAAGVLNGPEIGAIDVGPFGIRVDGDRGREADEGRHFHPFKRSMAGSRIIGP
jgi:hypothetical protein